MLSVSFFFFFFFLEAVCGFVNTAAMFATLARAEARVLARSPGANTGVPHYRHCWQRGSTFIPHYVTDFFF